MHAPRVEGVTAGATAAAAARTGAGARLLSTLQSLAPAPVVRARRVLFRLLPLLLVLVLADTCAPPRSLHRGRPELELRELRGTCFSLSLLSLTAIRADTSSFASDVSTLRFGLERLEGEVAGEDVALHG